MDRNILHKEIDLIQECIKRMAHNSFMLKGWTISLVAVVLALGNDYDFKYLCLILLLSTICFWYLDAFFLRTEKKYRKMYEWVIKNRKDTEEYLYNLDSRRFDKDINGRLKMMRSETLGVFYGIPTLALAITFLITSGTPQFLYKLIKELLQKGTP